MKLAVINLDALGLMLMRKYDMENVERFYNKNGDVLGISSLPHTAFSVNLIHSGKYNKDPYKAWVKVEKSSRPTRWRDPAAMFSRDEGKPSVPHSKMYNRYDDFPYPYIWDYTIDEGLDTVVFRLPIQLPPFSLNSYLDKELGDYWFPDTEERIRGHTEKKPKLIQQYFEDGVDVVFSSIQTPDKVQHHLANHNSREDEEFAQEVMSELDEWVGEFHNFCEENNITYLFYGDHGSPHLGAILLQDTKFMIPRHRKESIVFTNSNREPPRYTENMFDWMATELEIDTDKEVEIVKSEGVEFEDEEIMDRLERLGYLK